MERKTSQNYRPGKLSTYEEEDAKTSVLSGIWTKRSDRGI